MKKGMWMLAVLLAALLFGPPAQSEDAWIFRVEGGLAYLTSYHGYGTEIVVPQEVDGIPVYGLDNGVLPDVVKIVTLPVAVGWIGESAIPAGATVQARHGAFALAWAEEHGCKAEDLSQPGFSSLVVDLTGSDYRKTEDGISLGPALGKALRTGVALYVPETKAAWGVNRLAWQGERWLAEVEEADILLTYEQVRFSTRSNGTGGSGAVSPTASVSFKPNREYRLSLNPRAATFGGQDIYTIIRDLDIDITVNTAALVSRLVPGADAVVAGWNIGSILTGQPENVIDVSTMIEKCYIHGDYDLGISFTTPPGNLTGELEITGTSVGIPLGTTGLKLELSPFARFQYSNEESMTADFGYEHMQFTLDCDNRNGSRRLDGGITAGTPYFRSQYLDSSSFAVSYGIAVSIVPKVNLATFTVGEIAQSISFETDSKSAFVADYRGTAQCRDVTWTVERSIQLTFSPGIDFEPWKTETFKLNAYAQRDFDLGNDTHIGATLGTNTSIYLTREVRKALIPWPRTIENYSMDSGETAHFEPDAYGKWKKVDSCQRQRALHFDPAIEGLEAFDVDCSDFSSSDWSTQNISLYYPGMNFDGWYTDEGDNFFSNLDTYTGSDTWTGSRTLTAHWTEDEEIIPWPEADVTPDQEVTHWDLFVGTDYCPYDNPNLLTDYKTIRLYDGHNKENAVAFWDDFIASYDAYDLAHMGFPNVANVRVGTLDNPNRSDYYRIEHKDDHAKIVNGAGSANVINVVYDDRVCQSDGYSCSPNLKTVTGNGHMYKIGIYRNCPNLETVTGIDGITELQSYAFYNCTSLRRIDLPETVTEITAAVFENCTSLSGVTLPSSLKKIWYNAFRNCTSLIQINLPEGLTEIWYGAFENSGLTSVSIPSTVTSLQYWAFRGCKSLKTVSIPGHLESLGREAFRNCVSLEDITVDADRIDDYAFDGCTKLKSVTLKNVTEFGKSLFSNAPELETIHIIGDQIPYVTDTSYDRILYGSGVKNLVIDAGSRLTGLKLDSLLQLETITVRGNGLGSFSIEHCPSLKTLTIQTEGTVSCVDLINCQELTSVNLQCAACSELRVSNCQRLAALQVTTNLSSVSVEHCSLLRTLVLGPTSGEYPHLNISDLPHLETFEIADGTDTQNSRWYANFSNCPVLHELSVPMDADTAKIYCYGTPALITRRAGAVSIGDAVTLMHFTGTYGIENNDLRLVPGSEFTLFSPPNASGNGSYWRIFKGWVLNGNTASMLQPGDRITVPEGESTLYALYEQNLDSTDIRSGVLYGYTRNSRDSGTRLTVSEGITGLAANCIGASETYVYIGRNVRTVDPLAFARAECLERIEVDPGNSWFSAADGILYGKSGALLAVPAATPLTEYDIPESVSSIGAHAFNEGFGSRLISVTVPAGVTSVGDDWYAGIRNCPVYGPVDGPVAASAMDAGLIYNVFPVYFISDNLCVAAGAAQAGTELPAMRNLRDDGTFLGWSLTAAGDPIDGPVIVPYGGLTLYAQWLKAPPPATDFVLPRNLEIIGEEAFAQIDLRSVCIPASVKQLSARVFSGSGQLKLVYFKGRDTAIDEAAFEGIPADVVIYGLSGSTAEAFAAQHGFEFIALDQ